MSGFYDGFPIITVDAGPFAYVRAQEKARQELGTHVEVLGQVGWDPIADTVSFLIEEEGQ